MTLLAGGGIETLTPELLLAAVARAGTLAPSALEFSIRLRPGRAEKSGRFTLWFDDAAGDPAFAGLLRALGAPAGLETAPSAYGLVRCGLGAAFGAMPELRLYLHGRDARLNPTYRAFRWRGGAAREARYRCHLLPETPAGERPADFVHPALRPAAAALAAAPDAVAFWLREGEAGRIDQIDLAFPAEPEAGSLGGFDPLLATLAVPAADRGALARLPVRHIAFAAAGASPAATLYLSAPAQGEVPRDEAVLQRLVVERATARSAGTRRRLARLPGPAPATPALDGFYDGGVETWRQALGEDLHYHHGLFANGGTDGEAAARRAVTELYPFIPAGGRLYDIGCGWGGPLAMIVRDLACPAVGVTISRSQYRHVAGRGLTARLADAAATWPPGRFDCALLLESLEHVADKPALLARLRPFADRLVMRVNCQDASPAGTAFGGTMHMIASGALRATLEGSGWMIRHWRNRRMETLPSQRLWLDRLSRLPEAAFARDRHLDVFRAWCARVVATQAEWAANNPLIELAAD